MSRYALLILGIKLAIDLFSNTTFRRLVQYSSEFAFNNVNMLLLQIFRTKIKCKYIDDEVVKDTDL